MQCALARFKLSLFEKNKQSDIANISEKPGENKEVKMKSGRVGVVENEAIFGV